MDEVTAIQAAALTGLSERTIRRRIATGRLPARRIAPNRYAINVEDLPRRPSHRNGHARLEALEKRIEALEAQQRLLMRVLERSAPPALAQPVDDPDDIVRLDDLLLQLASAIERFSPRYVAHTDPRHDPRPERRVR